MRLADVQRLCVPRSVLERTWDALRHFGQDGDEGFVLWLGRIDEAGDAHVLTACVPPQEQIHTPEGVGYVVGAQALFELNVLLHRHQLRMLAQVHSHPGEAYHSQTDDDYAIMTTEGGFSIVVPDFAACDMRASECAVYRLQQGTWTELSSREVDKVFDWETE